MNHNTVLLLFVLMVSNVIGDSIEDASLESSDKGDGTFLVSVDNDDSKDLSDTDESTSLEDDQMLKTVEVTAPYHSLKQPIFRQHYGREYAKPREYLQCKDEEPIIFMCSKSCHNVFLSVCSDFRCPPRLKVQTKKDCFENCKKTYKGLRGQQYIPPEKY